MEPVPSQHPQVFPQFNGYTGYYTDIQAHLVFFAWWGRDNVETITPEQEAARGQESALK